jgi:hypothetical protein
MITDFTKSYCLICHPDFSFSIKGIVTEEILKTIPKNLKIQCIEVGDYICQWIDKRKPMTGFYKEHQIIEYTGPSTGFFMIDKG